MQFSRRQFLALTALSGMGVGLGHHLLAASPRKAGYGSLQPDPQGLLDLPKGFQYRFFSRQGDRMDDGTLVPGAHDGMAAFPGAKGTTILIRNHELSPDASTAIEAPVAQKFDPNGKGGTTTLIVSADRQLLRHYPSLAGTVRNCAGGITPWGSWISCEEDIVTPSRRDYLTPVQKRHGYNFEVPALGQGLTEPVPLIAMGRFRHEAIVVDPRTGIVYQTEDQGDGLFYRFIPTRSGDLKAGGRLEALRIKEKPGINTRRGIPVGQSWAVDWVPLDDVDPEEDTLRQEGFAKGAAQFSRGEGLCLHQGHVYLTCTNGGNAGVGQVWRYTPGQGTSEGGTIVLFFESPSPSVLNFPDNLIATPRGDLLICEDGQGEIFVVGITPSGDAYPFARNALNGAEFAGICFSPDGQTLFLNLYQPGITFAIWGPWPWSRE